MSDSINSNNKENYNKFKRGPADELGPGRTETPCQYPNGATDGLGNEISVDLAEEHKVGDHQEY